MSELIKSRKLQEEQEAGRGSFLERSVGAAGGEDAAAEAFVNEAIDGVVNIRPIRTFSEWAIVLQDMDVPKTIEVSKGGADTMKRPEGFVVGVSGDPHDRPANLPKIGDRVKFYQSSVLESIRPEKGHYKGKTLAVIQEKNILFEVPTDMQVNIVS